MMPLGFSAIVMLSVILEIGDATKSIYIIQDRMSSNSVMITCTISGEKAISYKAYLHCPLADTNFCYKDCSAECRYANGGCVVPPELKSIERCDRDVIAEDHIRIRYIINTDNVINRNGEWYCSFAGINSKPLKLNIIERPKISNNDAANASTKLKYPQVPDTRQANGKSAENPLVVQVPKGDAKGAATERPASREKMSSKTESSDDFNFKMFVTKYQVVIGIICLLAISVMLNFIFCIRDSLIKQFIDNIKNNNSSSKYLLYCICQSDSYSVAATSKLDRILSKEPDYISNGASNCSKTDIFNIDSQRPLISNMYSNMDSHSNTPSKLGRSASMQNPDIPPRLVPMGYEPCYMTTPRGYTPYIYNPYLMNRTNLGPTESMNEHINQRHSYVFPSQIIPMDHTPAVDLHNSKKHASENDIDLIRYCDDQLENDRN